MNNYWLFSILPLTVATMGMVIGSVSGTWDWTVWALAMAALWLLDQGMKSVDLAAPDVNVTVDPRIQYPIGFGMIAAGAVVAIVAAWMTTWLALGILVLGVFLGLAYNLEWFGGRLHDRKYLTGWGNLGFTLGWLCTVLGYVYASGTVSLGIAIFAFGPMASIGTMAWVTEDMKDEMYARTGIEHRRKTERNVERLIDRELHSQFVRVLGFVAMAVGITLEFVV
ncbi:hypothetical protein GCM10025298_19440 [Natronobiforma cellulositropha]